MHTFEGKGGTLIQYNSDGSGYVRIREPETLGDRKIALIPCGDLIEFVAELVRSQRIEELEDASTEEVLGLPNRA